MVVSAAAWLVGLLLAFRLNTIQASTGDGEEFEYIIAAVVGGTALTGGYGSTIGAGIGALIMAMAVQGIRPPGGTPTGGSSSSAASSCSSSPTTTSAPRPSRPADRGGYDVRYAIARTREHLEVLRQHHRPPRRHHRGARRITCVLGDNGAGKSTFIKILAGVHEHPRAPQARGSGGQLQEPARRSTPASPPCTRPRHGAAHVGVAELLPRFRANQGRLAPRVDRQGRGEAHRQEEMAKMGIDIRDTEQPVGTPPAVNASPSPSPGGVLRRRC